MFVIPNKNIPEGAAHVESNVVVNNGADVNAFTERTAYNNVSEKPKMEDIVNPKPQKVDTSWLF